MSESGPPAPLSFDEARKAMAGVRARQIGFGLGFLAVGAQLVMAQGALLGLHASLGMMAVLAVASVANWRCPRCRAFLWVDTTGTSATRRRSRVRCTGCDTNYG